MVGHARQDVVAIAGLDQVIDLLGRIAAQGAVPDRLPRRVGLHDPEVAVALARRIGDARQHEVAILRLMHRRDVGLHPVAVGAAEGGLGVEGGPPAQQQAGQEEGDSDLHMIKGREGFNYLIIRMRGRKRFVACTCHRFRLCDFFFNRWL